MPQLVFVFSGYVREYSAQAARRYTIFDPISRESYEVGDVEFG